ncbi:hypothetical protein LTS17_010486 [Exophiala oligosperma]
MKVNSEKRAVACKQEVQISSADVAKSFASNVLSTGKSKIPTLIPRVDNPYDYSNRQKWFITTIVTIAAAAAPMGAAMFYPALPNISKDFEVSKTTTNLSVALYMLSMGIFPLWWSSVSEKSGRRVVYLISFFFNVAFTLACAFSTNMGMLIGFRVLAGGAASSMQSVGAGTVADIWESSQRGRAMGIYYLGPLLGPLIAPIIGGILAQRFGWRSDLWFLTAFGAVVFMLVIFALLETLIKQNSQISPPTSTDSPQGLPAVSSKSTKTFSRSAAQWFQRGFVDPLRVVLYLQFPAVLIVVYYAAITFGSLYVLNISVQSAFADAPYNFSALIIGLLYVPSSLGYVAASLLGGPWVDRIMIREAIKAGRRDASGHLIYLPEDRMQENAWISAVVYPGSLIWYGWTVQYKLHWIIPSIATFFYGAGSMLVFSATTTMLTEFMPRKASSGVALNNLVRNIFSCVGAIVGQPLISKTGHGWLMTLVGLVACTSGLACLWMLGNNADKWRAHMDKKLSNGSLE